MDENHIVDVLTKMQKQLDNIEAVMINILNKLQADNGCSIYK